MKSDSEKKKLLIFGGLALVLVAVAGWQLVGSMGGGKPSAQTSAKREAREAREGEAGGSPANARRTGPQGPMMRPGMSEEEMRAAAEDMYKREIAPHLNPDGTPKAGSPLDDGSGRPAPDTGPNGVAVPATRPGADVAAAMPVPPPGSVRRPGRDPFAQSGGGSPPTPGVIHRAPEPTPAPIRDPSRPRPNRMPSMPAPSVAPMDPLAGPLPDALPSPTAPPVLAGGDQPGGEGPKLTPGKPLRQPGELPMRLVGVVLGPRPLVVLQDDDGKQKSFGVGSEVVPGSRILRIERRKVVVRHLGKQIALTFGGNP